MDIIYNNEITSEIDDNNIKGIAALFHLEGIEMVYNFKTVYETERYKIEVPQMVSDMPCILVTDKTKTEEERCSGLYLMGIERCYKCTLMCYPAGRGIIHTTTFDDEICKDIDERLDVDMENGETILRRHILWAWQELNPESESNFTMVSLADSRSLLVYVTDDDKALF